MTNPARTFTATLTFFITTTGSIGFSDTPEISSLEKEAAAIAQEFASTLKPALLEAMNTGGPIHAIEVCSQQAPLIAENLSTQSGWQVKRVSLKARNATSAIPDDWESDALSELETRAAKDDPSDLLVITNLTDSEFRFLKGQTVQPLCLTCHGDSIDDDVYQAILKRYPRDIATGYTLGQLRGAISLRKNLSE